MPPSMTADRICDPNAPLGELLDPVQRNTVDYFWKGADPESGLPYDRRLSWSLAPNDLVSIGGVGFGVMAIVVGTSRGWLSRVKARERVLLMLSYLERSPTFHGAFSHFVDGTTSQSVAFSKFDNDGDLVETMYSDP